VPDSAASPCPAAAWTSSEASTPGADPGNLPRRVDHHVSHPLGLEQDRVLERAERSGIVPGSLRGDLLRAFHAEAGQPAPADELPPPGRQGDPGAVLQLATKYEIEILAPPGTLPENNQR
jgi:hypothetical protein